MCPQSRAESVLAVSWHPQATQEDATMADKVGTDNPETLTGTSANDVLKGLGGADTLIAGSGNDTLKGGAGADRLDGGTDIDTASYALSTEGVSVNLTTGFGFGGEAQGDRLTNIENLIGSSHDDGLFGDFGRNELNGEDGNDLLVGGGGVLDRLNGGAGNDILIGGDGLDILDGGSGDDTLKGGGGNDFLDGGDGIDTASFAGSAVGVSVDLSTGIAVVSSANAHLYSIENVIGTAYADYLNGDDNANVLNGGGGMDTLHGRGGIDTLYGDDGNDNLWGEDGHDAIYGDGGNDYLDGGIGNDRLYGGLGQDWMLGGDGGDRFIWTSTAETQQAGDMADFVFDFDRSQGDVIDVSLIDADANAGNGDTAFTLRGPVDFNSNFFTGAGQIGYLITTTDIYIFINTVVNPNANGIDFEEATIRLSREHTPGTPDASWFAM